MSGRVANIRKDIEKHTELIEKRLSRSPLLRLFQSRSRTREDQELLESYTIQLECELVFEEAASDRTSPQRCLICGSTEIEFFDAPTSDKEKAISWLNFEHPNCGGRLFRRSISIQVSVVLTTRHYGLDGSLIFEDKKDPLKKYFSERFS